MKKFALFFLCLAPLFRLIWAGLHAGLGANPVEFVQHFTGDWTLNFFCLTLAVTPLVRITGLSWWMRSRRRIGLFVAFYATLHFATYLWLDMEFRWGEFITDVGKRPYICVGFAAWLLLVPLVLTSNDWMIRRLKKWWPRLHRLVYPAAILGVIHYYWLVKADTRWPLRYAAALAVLLAFRLLTRIKTST